MKNIVKIPVWDMETGELVDMEIDEECLQEMDKIQEEANRRRTEARRMEKELQRHDRDQTE